MFIKADKKILVKIHMFIHEMAFDFFNHTKIGNSQTVIVDGFANLLKYQNLKQRKPDAAATEYGRLQDDDIHE